MLSLSERNKLKAELDENGVSKERQREIIEMLDADEERKFLLDIKSECRDEGL